MRRSIFISISIFLLSSCAAPAPMQTATSRPELREETPTQTSVPSTATITPTPEPTITPTWQATRTPLPLETYYDAEFGISVDYPAWWEMVAPRHFEGEDGSLTIKELKGYSTYDLGYVCNDYKIIHGYSTFIIPYDPGCVNVLSDQAQTHVFIFRYAVSERGAHYLVMETTGDFFRLIANSLRRDDSKNIYLSNHILGPAPKEGRLNPNAYIREKFIGIATYDWERWVPQEIDWEKSIREDSSPNTYREKLCGPEVFVEGTSYTSSYKDGRIEITEDEKIVLATEDPFPLSYGFHFCVLDGHWFLATVGYLLRDGEVLNYRMDYDDIHTWRLLNGKPFYFFVRDGKTWISLNNQVLAASYDYVWHDDCCTVIRLSDPSANNDTIWFYAVRDGAWYSVELRVTD